MLIYSFVVFSESTKKEKKTEITVITRETHFDDEKNQLHNLQNNNVNTVQYNTIQYNTILYYTILYNTIQYNTIQYSTAQNNKWITCCNRLYFISLWNNTQDIKIE